MNAYLRYKEKNPQHLHTTTEIVAALAVKMPLITIDWSRARQELLDRIAAMEKLAIPSAVIDSVRWVVEQSVYISIQFPDFPSKRIDLYVAPENRLELKSSDPTDEEFVQVSAERIADALEMTYLIGDRNWCLSDDVE